MQTCGGTLWCLRYVPTRPRYQLSHWNRSSVSTHRFSHILCIFNSKIRNPKQKQWSHVRHRWMIRLTTTYTTTHRGHQNVSTHFSNFNLERPIACQHSAFYAFRFFAPTSILDSTLERYFDGRNTNCCAHTVHGNALWKSIKIYQFIKNA